MNHLYATFKQQHPEVSFKQIVLPFLQRYVVQGLPVGTLT
jgi:hypothetical protein